MAEGREAGRAEVRAQVERLAGMFYDLAKPFEVLDAEVERELLTLAMALARQIVRRELKTDPTQIIGIIREAIAALPVAARDVRVHLHPEDAAVVRAASGAHRKRARLDDHRGSGDGARRMPDHHHHLAHRRAPGDAAGRNLERAPGHGAAAAEPAAALRP